MPYIIKDAARAARSGLLSWPVLKTGQSLTNTNVAFELFGQHAGTALMPVGAYSYSHSQFAVARIGRFCSIANNVRSMGEAHPHHWASTSPRFYRPRNRSRCQIPEPQNPLAFDNAPKPIIIEHDVWIGQDVLLRDGIRIGTGAVIAAGSVVTRSVAPYTIVGGNPARVIRSRFDAPLASRLLASEWWMYEAAKVIELPADDPERFVSLVEENSAGWKQRPLTYKTLEKHLREAAFAGAIALQD